MAKYLLGIDAGNTLVKCVIFDLAGRELALASREAGSFCPAPGFVERDIDQLRLDLFEVIGDVLAKTGIDASEIACIGCAGHGNGLYLLGEGGEAVIGIQSLDSRASALLKGWEETGIGDVVYPICLQRPWVSQTPTLLAWIKRERPDLYKKSVSVLACKDIVTHALTGELVSDISDMSGCGVLAMPENVYDQKLFDAYGIGDAVGMFPRVAEPHEIVGHVSDAASKSSGLAKGTPVVAGLFDVIASAFGSGVVTPGQASVVVGTWSINQIITDNPKLSSDAEVFMTAAFASNRFMAMDNSATSAANLEWMAHQFLMHDSEVVNGRSVFELANELVAAATTKPDSPFYHPYLYGAPGNGAARAGYYGIGGWHDRGDILRALYEGVAFAHLVHMRRLKSAGAKFDRVILSGGGARSPVWPQMISNMLAVPVDLAACQETGALGVAMAAAVGAGIYTDFEQASKQMTSIVRTHQPDSEALPLIEQRFKVWFEIGEAMTPVWNKMSGV